MELGWLILIFIHNGIVSPAEGGYIDLITLCTTEISFGAVGWGTALQAGSLHVRFPMAHYSPTVDTASNRNKYQEYFFGVKAASA